jgi:hypothetical protein
MFIPDPGSEFFHPGSRIRIDEVKCFNPKNLNVLTQKLVFKLSKTMIRVVRWFISNPSDPDPAFLPSVGDP